MSTLDPILVEPTEGRHITIFGDVEFFVKVRAEQSGGVFSLLDNVCPPGTFLPPHIHHREDETFYILEGEFEFQVGGQTLKAGPGTTVFGPRGVAHSFRVTSATRGRSLVYATPGGFERCMQELSELPAGPPDMAAIGAICMSHGIEFLPPPA
jgi:mannose-6-phosphate isomerase-like protein (cupin superfamily)